MSTWQGRSPLSLSHFIYVHHRFHFSFPSVYLFKYTYLNKRAIHRKTTHSSQHYRVRDRYYLSLTLCFFTSRFVPADTPAQQSISPTAPSIPPPSVRRRKTLALQESTLLFPPSSHPLPACCVQNIRFTSMSPYKVSTISWGSFRTKSLWTSAAASGKIIIRAPARIFSSVANATVFLYLVQYNCL